MICPVCGSNLTSEDCPTCIKTMNKCILCFLEFKDGDELVQCLECNYFGHSYNFNAWLKKSGKCPVCRITYHASGFKKIFLQPDLFKQTYQIKSRLRLKREEIFEDFSFRLDFYDFQTLIIQKIQEDYNSKNNFLLISPPGSGKTIIGLALAGKLSYHTLILTPNLAVLGSWMDRVSMFLETSNNEIQVQDVINIEEGELRPLTITTYAKIHLEILKKKKTKTKRNSENLSEVKREELTLIDHLKSHNIKFLILDEAHRLTGKWGKSIAKLIKEFPDIKILGLTATPPKYKTDFFSDIFGDERFEIPLPLLVRKGILAPYNDMAVTYPSYFDLKTEITEKLTDPEMIDLLEFVDPDKYDLDNYYKVLSDRVNNILSKLDTQEEKNLIQASFEYDLIRSAHHTHMNMNDVEWLYENNSYLTVLAFKIIKLEMEIQKGNIRILVLLDQENHPVNYSLPLTGINGAIGIFEKFVLDPEIDMLQPVLVTGKSLLVDDDFTSQFIALGRQWAKSRGLQIDFKTKKLRKKKYTIINGTGKHWNTETYTRYVTYLFDHGITRLLVGTRFLLGEGWDSLTLNTLIDLTTIKAYTTVNQVKGRAFRMDPNNPNKISNIWEVMPNMIFHEKYQFGKYLLSNFMEKHRNYFGIDDNGDIRNNIHRLNSEIYTKSVSFMKNGMVYDKSAAKYETLAFLTTNYDIINKSAFKKSRERIDRSFALKQKWKVGQDLGDIYLSIPFTFKDAFTNIERVLVDWEFVDIILFTIAELFRCYDIEVVLKKQDKYKYLIIVVDSKEPGNLEELISSLNNTSYQSAIVLDFDFSILSDEIFDFTTEKWILQNQSRIVSYVFPMEPHLIEKFRYKAVNNQIIKIRSISSFKELAENKIIISDHIGRFVVESIYLTKKDLQMLTEEDYVRKYGIATVPSGPNDIIEPLMNKMVKQFELNFELIGDVVCNEATIVHFTKFLREYAKTLSIRNNEFFKNSNWKAMVISNEAIVINIAYNMQNLKIDLMRLIQDFISNNQTVLISLDKPPDHRIEAVYDRIIDYLKSKINPNNQDVKFQTFLNPKNRNAISPKYGSYYIMVKPTENTIPIFKLISASINKQGIRDEPDLVATTLRRERNKSKS